MLKFVVEALPATRRIAQSNLRQWTKPSSSLSFHLTLPNSLSFGSRVSSMSFSSIRDVDELAAPSKPSRQRRRGSSALRAKGRENEVEEDGSIGRGVEGDDDVFSARSERVSELRQRKPFAQRGRGSGQDRQRDEPARRMDEWTGSSRRSGGERIVASNDDYEEESEEGPRQIKRRGFTGDSKTFRSEERGAAKSSKGYGKREKEEKEKEERDNDDYEEEVEPQDRWSEKKRRPRIEVEPSEGGIGFSKVYDKRGEVVAKNGGDYGDSAPTNDRWAEKRKPVRETGRGLDRGREGGRGGGGGGRFEGRGGRGSNSGRREEWNGVERGGLSRRDPRDGGAAYNRNKFSSPRGSDRGSVRGSGDRGPSRDRFPRRDGRRDDDEEEDSEPIYGRYDGDHLFGVSPILAALKSKRRQFSELIVQEGKLALDGKEGRAVMKADGQEIVKLAKEMKIPIREFGKHELNMMSENRPHQGFILRAKPLQYLALDRLPFPKPLPSGNGANSSQLILALDEVMDPQNLGALLRSCLYLGCSTVVVSEKNSAPLSAVVSKASAGAMELMTLYSTKNMMNLVDRAKDEGWLVVGTALSASEKCVPMEGVPRDRPIVLVLGNEGHGLRTNMLYRCDYLVNIPSSFSATSSTDGPHSTSMSTVSESKGEETSSLSSLVDSLNVSVTGGILLHYFLNRR